MTPELEARITRDLADSGLTKADFPWQEMDNAVKAATHTPHSTQGYRIPYYNIRGIVVPHYRVKLFDSDPKYKQPKDTANHVYFPVNFLQATEKGRFIIITEGEKKAAAATKAGFPAVAFGGTESWRNRILSLPEEATLTQHEKGVTAKLPSGIEVSEDMLSPLAIGLQELIDYALNRDLHLIILYDNDHKQETNHNVQRAAASLGYELRFRGIPYNRIRQIRLPIPEREEKIGLDDYLELGNEEGAGPAGFQALIRGCLEKPSAFPRHPNVRDYVNKRLQKAKMSRREMQQVAMSILCELDSSGLRLRSTQALQTYFFDKRTHKLLRANFTDDVNGLSDDPFGQYLYRTFGIGAADNRLVQWLGTLFTGEDPVSDVSPYRVFARPIVNKDSVMYQISDGQYVEVDGTGSPSDLTPGFKLHDNGANNVLFEAGQVKPLDPVLLAREYAKQVKEPPRMWWGEVLNEVRLVDKDKQRILTALLFYISPWLYRWRGTQLPIEMTLGEAGSGKSTLQEFRLDILTGEAKLRNAASDMKDWTASVANAGGLHVTDNLQLPDKNMRQRLSDEICRIITEPNPTVEQRKYYTNNDLLQIPVRCVFGITAIKQPFLNSDVLARSIIIELDKSRDLVAGTLSYDESWKRTQMERFGGREAWVAHHLVALHRFFNLVVQRSWNYKYQAKHRLINFEQAIILMSNVFGMNAAWIPDFLNGIVNRAVEDADWALDGIITFANEWREMNGPTKITASEIADWAFGHDEFKKCEELTNTRRCGRYMQTHKTLIASLAGIIEAGKTNNRAQWQILQPKQMVAKTGK